MTSEELAAMQLQQAMIQNNQEGEEYAQDNMQLINEVPLEEEEGESQDVTQSRKLHSQQHHQQQYSNQFQDQQEVEQ